MRRFSVVMLLCSLVGCAQILDIEERKGDGTGASASCARYCDDVMSTCTEARGAQLFDTTEQCLAVCGTYPSGAEANAAGNSLACRVAAIQEADGAGEYRNSCAPASSGGGTADPGAPEKSCGTNCEGYCSLYEATCKPTPDCVRRCAGIRDIGLRNASENFLSNADTLQCRLAHVATAAFYKQRGDDKTSDIHCGHSGIKTTGQCDSVFTCESYCQLVNTACTGASAVYASNEQCLAVCAKIKPGEVKEIEANNLRCRREYGYQALEVDPIRFCTHAGPVPGLCGDLNGNRKCESYCSLLAAGCESQFATKWGGLGEDAQARCRMSCTNTGLNGIGVNGTFSINNTSENDRANTLNCRTSRLLSVFSGDKRPETCLAAFGGGACGNETIP